MMRKVKYVSLLLFVVLFSFSCTENGTSPTQPEVNPNPGNEKTGTSSSTSPPVYYDDFAYAQDFVIDGRRWNDTDLTYYFSSGTANISGDQEQQAISDAFSFWAEVTLLTFTEVSSESQADIVFLWATGAHGDQNPFDGNGDINGNVLAHAFSPPPTGGSLAGDAHFDDAETWTFVRVRPFSGLR
jgi:hypothetical protein